MDMSGYTEVTPAPDDLLPDDRVVTTYPLFQTGDWLMAYQVSELEKKLEEDGRWELLSWQYDPDAPSITFLVRVRRPEEIPTKVYLAGFKLAALLGVFAAIIYFIGYETGKTVKVYRVIQATKDAAVQAIDKEPTLTPEQKEAAKNAVLSAVPNPPREPIGWPAAVVWIAAAALAWIFFGSRSR